MKPPSSGGGLEGGFFRRACHPIYTFGKGQSPVRLDLYEEACFVEFIDKRLRELQGRLAAGDDDVTRFVPACLSDNLVLAHLPVGLMIGVAERALQIAPREAQEEGRRAGEVPLSLKRKKRLVNPQLYLRFNHLRFDYLAIYETDDK